MEESQTKYTLAFTEQKRKLNQNVISKCFKMLFMDKLPVILLDFLFTCNFQYINMYNATKLFWTQYSTYLVSIAKTCSHIIVFVSTVATEHLSDKNTFKLIKPYTSITRKANLVGIYYTLTYQLTIRRSGVL